MFYFLGEDATEDPDENPFATASLAPEHEHLYVDDPKRALKGFYEREGILAFLYVCVLFTMKYPCKSFVIGSFFHLANDVKKL